MLESTKDRTFRTTLGLAACLSVITVSPISAVAADTDRPNVIVIMVDDLGFSDIGCYGSEIA
jgi:arylsulfatase